MTDIQDTGRRPQGAPAAVARTAQDALGNSAAVAGDKAADVAQTAKEQAADVVGEATSQAKDLIGEFKGQLQDQAGSQTRRLAQNVRRFADELREMSGNGPAGSPAAGLVGRVAEGGRQVADRMEERGPEGLVTDLQDFARRRPGVFLAGAALAGFAAARVVHGLNAAAPSGSGTGTRAVPAAGPDRDAADSPPNAGTGTTPAPERGGDRAVYADPLDTYGQSQPPHVTPDPQGAPAPPVHPPGSLPGTDGSAATERG
ncbi:MULTISPECIES: hypothetical protein [unclassified Streptomyces]|uniref:hypothetical protein n=1 Tax=unclassified Streptomyces TaxID=2593676 RepID=UPI002E305D08|nr:MULTISPECIES: hypothetical protein [unclassified Streptomyces]WUC63742.1 hypothetical protein OG861_05600 [Streptomyces sp. NBC_00539]